MEQAPLKHKKAISPYRRLWRFSVIVFSLVAITPLVILTIINYLQDQDAYKAESRFAIARILTSTERTLEFVIEERRAALSLIINERPYEELFSDSTLTATLRNLNNAFGGFVDLGLIDSEGNQSYYVGPYDLKDKNYKGQSWFHEVLLRGAYVSDVFMGHRNFPHFVIAFKHEKSNGDFFVLRATLDMELINRQIFSLDLDRQTDAFVINQDGILQTASAFYGKTLEKADIDIPLHSRREYVEEREEKGGWATSGFAYIEKTPFILIVIRKQVSPVSHWIDHRSDLIWIVLVSVALILAVVLYRSGQMIRRLRDADSRRVQALHNVEYTNKMATIGRMAASVAHEINNPLAIINEKAGLMRDMATFTENFPQKDKTLSLVDSIVRSVDRCSQVTRRLLGFARRMDVKSELIDLENLLKEVVGFQETEAAHRNITVDYAFPKDLPAIESDRGQLQQVFLNIVSNAFAAVDDGGKLNVSAEPSSNGKITVTIQDNGHGIPPENLKHIFEPFFSTKGEFGTGLGLSITRGIVEKLGGMIDVDSIVGQGTTFHVTLPLKHSDIRE